MGRQGGKAAQRRPGSAQNAARTELWQTADVQTIKFKDIAYSCVCVCEREGNASALAGAICNRVCCILCGRIARGSSCACVDFSSPVNNTHTQTHPVHTHTHTCALCLPSACLLSFNYANAKCKQYACTRTHTNTHIHTLTHTHALSHARCRCCASKAAAKVL